MSLGPPPITSSAGSSARATPEAQLDIRELGTTLHGKPMSPDQVRKTQRSLHCSRCVIERYSGPSVLRSISDSCSRDRADRWCIRNAKARLPVPGSPRIRTGTSELATFLVALSRALIAGLTLVDTSGLRAESSPKPVVVMLSSTIGIEHKNSRFLLQRRCHREQPPGPRYELIQNHRDRSFETVVRRR